MIKLLYIYSLRVNESSASSNSIPEQSSETKSLKNSSRTQSSSCHFCVPIDKGIVNIIQYFSKGNNAVI